MIHIYKLYNINDESLCYVGKTKQHIEVRKSQHYANRNKSRNTSISKLMCNEPLEHFKIELLETCNESEAKEKEQYYIELYGILNICNAIKNSNYDKEYSKQYRQKKRNLEKHNEEAKAFYHKHKDVILTKLALNRVTCECGMEVRKQHLKRHQNGSYHKYLINQTAS